jgi:hypothetical protein
MQAAKTPARPHLTGRYPQQAVKAVDEGW